MKKVALTIGLLLAAAITGCDSGPSQQSAPVQTLSIKGSDTMVHLVSSWTAAALIILATLYSLRTATVLFYGHARQS